MIFCSKTPCSHDGVYQYFIDICYFT